MGMILRFRQKLTQAAMIGVLGITTIAMNGCDAIYWDEEASLAKVKAKGELVVLTTQDPLIYSQSKKSKKTETFGIDHDLIESFAGYYNIKVRFVVLPDEDSVLRALSKGEGDLAAARLKTPQNKDGFLIAPAYDESYLSLYCHRKSQVQNIKDLDGKKLVILNKDNFHGLSQRLTQLSPSINIEAVDSMKVQELLGLVAQKKYDCAIAENFSGDFYARYQTQIEKITAMTESFSQSWLITPDNQDLLSLVQAWYQKASREDEIIRVLDRYKTYLSELDKRDIMQFFKKIRSTLPEYREAFKEAAEEHGLPWQLVASVAYQESHWDSEAVSFTGVRGLMQLTEDTAEHVGIEDRNDPLQSIWGGSKYLRYLLDKTPNFLNSKDRLSLALAAYNVGAAHLRDAQKLAIKLGRNPNSWKHLREVLPLLADPAYADDLEYGPARGYETVEFVERVKSFYNLMSVAG